MNKVRGTGISISKCTSPRKVQQQPRTLYEKMQNIEVPTGNEGEGAE